MPTISLGPECGQYEVWVECGGWRLDEFDVKHDPVLSRRTCFVTSTEGEKFTIHCKREGLSLHVVRAEIYLDGVYAAGSIIEPQQHSSISMTGSIVSESSLRPFQFGSLKLTDDDAALADPQTLVELGTIRIRFDPVQIVSRNAPMHFVSKALPGEKAIHERSKKAGSHAIKFGQAEAARVGNFVKVTTLSSVSPPQEAVFTYASKEILRAREIIPMSPKPESAAISRSIIPPVASSSRNQPSGDNRPRLASSRSSTPTRIKPEKHTPSSKAPKHPIVGLSPKDVNSSIKIEKSSGSKDEVIEISSDDDQTPAKTKRKIKKEKTSPRKKPRVLSGPVIDLDSD